MSSDDRHEVGGPSMRLIQVLKIYCRDLAPPGVDDLRASLKDGHYPWFQHEFAVALSDPATGTQWWIDAIGDLAVSNSNRAGNPIQRRQKLLWRTLFPGTPWPVARPNAA
jgi:hypothetical protein